METEVLNTTIAPVAAVVPETKWYVLRVVSGKEKKIKEYLDKDIVRNNWTNIIKQVFLPMEKVYKVQKGKKVMREKNYFPGYVMMEVIDNNSGRLADDIVMHISNINNVMHFLTDGKGSKGNIICLRKSEVNKMLGKVDEMNDLGGSISEPFIYFNGVIEEVNEEKKKLKVTVKIFGRSTPVELSFMQVEKLS